MRFWRDKKNIKKDRIIAGLTFEQGMGNRSSSPPPKKKKKRNRCKCSREVTRWRRSFFFSFKWAVSWRDIAHLGFVVTLSLSSTRDCSGNNFFCKYDFNPLLFSPFFLFVLWRKVKHAHKRGKRLDDSCVEGRGIKEKKKKKKSVIVNFISGEKP